MTAGALGCIETQRSSSSSADDPLVLESARRSARSRSRTRRTGTLDEDRANAVFVHHALTGDAHAAGHHGDPSGAAGGTA